MNTSNQFCTFYLDGLFFGIEVQKVQEVIRFQPMTRVPLASPAILGVINLRGDIVPALDLRRQLQLSDRASDEIPTNVVVRSESGPVSLLVDSIGDVATVEESSFECLPNTVVGIAREMIRGAYKLKNHLLLLLDTEKVVSLREPSLN